VNGPDTVSTVPTSVIWTLSPAPIESAVQVPAAWLKIPSAAKTVTLPRDDEIKLLKVRLLTVLGPRLTMVIMLVIEDPS